MRIFNKIKTLLVKAWRHFKSIFTWKRRKAWPRIPKRDEFLPSPPISEISRTTSEYSKMIGDPIFYAIEDKQSSKFFDDDANDQSKFAKTEDENDYGFSTIVKKVLSKLGVDPDKYDSITWVDIEFVQGKKIPVGIMVIEGDHPKNTRDDVVTVIILTKVDVNFACDFVNDDQEYGDEYGEDEYDFIKNVDEEFTESESNNERIMLYLSKIVLPKKLAIAFSKIILGS